MGLLNKKYYKLKPTEEYLTDEVILALAWKKSHEYIRSTNWYVDTFELDRSAINLENHLKKWIKDIESEDFKFEPLRLIPAPKSHKWHFKNHSDWTTSELIGENILSEAWSDINDIWEPIIEGDAVLKGLRPLAHVGIRDQSLNTMLMMCLANEVETTQGNTETSLEEVHREKIVSYGNRLYCEYQDKKAHFNWGNSTVYNKYFTDYQRFLLRPAYFGRKALETINNNEIVYEIHVDITKFFDRVNRKILREKLLELVNNYSNLIANRLIDGLVDWKWKRGSSDLYSKVCSEEGSKLPLGIPQGLVAGGFYANVYLLDFDQEMAMLIGETIGKNFNLKLVDYCRYVDDMRFIVIADKSGSNRALTKEIVKENLLVFLKEYLSPLGLSLNNEKTKIDEFRSSISGISTKLKLIQSTVSGPLSYKEIDEQLGHLEGLIHLAESLKPERERKSTNSLASIENYSLDVRDDTLLRFSANKIHNLLKSKRHMTSHDVDENGDFIAEDWDYLQERFSRRFIALWSHDPSMVLLLKKGLELFPDIRILDPVLEQLHLLLIRCEAPKERQTAIYCLCEIFRHSATIIHTKDRETFPVHANIDNFFERLSTEAINLLGQDSELDENLSEQARFFCLVRNDSPLDIELEAQDFNIISKLMIGHRNIEDIELSKSFATNSILAFQMAKDKSLVIKSINSCIAKRFQSVKLRPSAKRFIKKIIIEAPELFEAIYKSATTSRSAWLTTVKDLIDASGVKQKAISGDLSRLDSTVIPILKILKRHDNPLAHENAALILMNEILSRPNDLGSNIDITLTKISCSNWKRIQSFEAEVQLDVEHKTSHDLHPIPKWVSEEHEPLYRLGVFLRSCLLGGASWAGSNLRISNSSHYVGIKSCQFKRQLGMMHTPEALNGDSSPMSGWLSGLLFHLLQWPGLSLKDDTYTWPKIWSIDSLRKLVSERIESQRKLFCKLSEIPGYVEKIDLNWGKDRRNLNVVMVQSLLPLKQDFAKYGILLDSKECRARHRRHTAAVASLILHKIYAHKSVDDLHSIKVETDLIIWPELAIYKDDIDILKSLSEKTGAMIFAGLTFFNMSHVKGPTNSAIWIIPKKHNAGRGFIRRLQGKQHMMADEEKIGIKPWRPYQLFIELEHPVFKDEQGFRLTGSVCYDATDIKISADLKDKSNAYIVVALNKDVSTFDSLVDALYYHMYQHVVLVNTGEFGGSVAKAPYKERHHKLITHVHGANQVSISCFEMNMFDFRDSGLSFKSGKEIKTKPAG